MCGVASASQTSGLPKSGRTVKLRRKSVKRTTVEARVRCRPASGSDGGGNGARGGDEGDRRRAVRLQLDDGSSGVPALDDPRVEGNLPKEADAEFLRRGTPPAMLEGVVDVPAGGADVGGHVLHQAQDAHSHLLKHGQSL